MIKDKLREEMRAKRRALTSNEVKQLSEKIRNFLFTLDCVKNAKTVCTFLSSFKEPDTMLIVKWLLEKKSKVIVPISDTETTTLSLSYIEIMDNLAKGAYGILEPSVIRPADERDIDVILVPGLAFDRHGGRMGFGKGYYDRLLETSRAIKIGLCYDFQLFDTIPTQSHDIPMDFIVTEKEIYEIR
ncbi:MAG: 5-formyltetrahydrofolate cyclo-ligase [Hominilimicola sp.]